MDKYQIITQIIGYIATVLTVSSFQFKSQKGIMAVQSVSTVLWTVHFFMLGAISGSLLNLMCAIRSMIYAKRSTSPWARHISWVYIFTVLALVIYTLQFTTFGYEVSIKNMIVQFLPTLGVIATNVGYRLETGFKVRCSQFISSPCWLIYNAFSGSVGGVITEVIAFCSAVIGVIRHDIKDLKKSRHN